MRPRAAASLRAVGPPSHCRSRQDPSHTTWHGPDCIRRTRSRAARRGPDHRGLDGAVRSGEEHSPAAGHRPGDAPPEKALADELGPDRFEWLGWREDVTSVLAACDVLVQTSLNEGTPVALIQGMAAGRPFVSPPAGGIVDMVSGSLRGE